MWSSLAIFALGLATANACNDCSAGTKEVVQTRLVRRMQPDSQNATNGPKAPLEWGQINFLHTTDTHGWLEGHIKENNYGADWGDFASFARHMRAQAANLGVDLLLVDTGDLHDGAGLSDATDPPLNGLVSNPIFENIDYDVLTIGNHELYVNAISYDHFYNFAKVYGDKYVTSNVQIYNPSSKQFEYIGSKYRYFTTPQGLRVMAFGVLYTFTSNGNASKIIPAATMVKDPWFTQAVNFTSPIDLFLVVGHNPVRVNDSSSTFGAVYQAIRAIKPDTPIQVFGGHSHIRDFQVYDNKATALESGRYCETLGWLSMSGFNMSTYKAIANPKGVPNPSRGAVVVSPNATAFNLSLTKTSSSFTYARRYIDWNRRSFAYHANGSQDATFDIQQGKAITQLITGERTQLNLTSLYGCAPQTWCLSCKPFGDPGNLNTLLTTALGAVVVNSSRASTPRLILANSGSARFDLVKGPFTYDDSFIVSPFKDYFYYIPNVPYSAASQVLANLNAGTVAKRRRSLTTSDFGFTTVDPSLDACVDPPALHNQLQPRSEMSKPLVRRQTQVATTPGYVTTDDWGVGTGDDTVHTAIPNYRQPAYIQANGSFPSSGTPANVDVVFLDFIQSYVITALGKAGMNYTASNVGVYLPGNWSTNTYLPLYAKLNWQANVPNCPVGAGVGY